LDPEIEAKGWEKIRSTVQVDLADGRTLVEQADERYRGGPDLPFTREELYEKWSDCASLVLPTAAIDEVFELVDGLEKLDDVTTLVRALTANWRCQSAGRGVRCEAASFAPLPPGRPYVRSARPRCLDERCERTAARAVAGPISSLASAPALNP